MLRRRHHRRRRHHHRHRQHRSHRPLPSQVPSCRWQARLCVLGNLGQQYLRHRPPLPHPPQPSVAATARRTFCRLRCSCCAAGVTKARQKQYLEGKVAPAGSRRPRARYVTSSQVKAAAGHRDDDATAARAVASAGVIEWGEGGSFDALKLALSTSPVLRTFDPTRRAVLTTDASGVAVAAILTQPDDEGFQHPVAYESR